MKLYYVPQSSCYLEIVKVRYKGNGYIKAKVRWYSKSSMLLLVEENNVKIPLDSLKLWSKHEY